MSLSYPKLIAHRGYARHYPENTLLAIRAAVEAGAYYVEFDVQLTSDQVPVLFHDRDLQRMCGQAGAIHEHSLALLKTFSVSEFDKFGYKFVGNPITTLQEAVTYLASQNMVTAFVEVKRVCLQTHGIQTVLDKLLPLVETMGERVVVISYSLEFLQALRKRSDLPVAAVFDDWRERKNPLVRQLHPEYLFTSIESLPRFGRLVCKPAQLAVYECTDPQQAIKLHQRGVDLVETFAIGEMLRTFNKLT